MGVRTTKWYLHTTVVPIHSYSILYLILPTFLGRADFYIEKSFWSEKINTFKLLDRFMSDYRLKLPKAAQKQRKKVQETFQISTLFLSPSFSLSHTHKLTFSFQPTQNPFKTLRWPFSVLMKN